MFFKLAAGHGNFFLLRWDIDMAKFWAATTKGFYDSLIHSSMPPDAVEITDNHYEILLHGQSNGQIIQDDGTGHPEAVDPPPPTTEEKIKAINAGIISRLKDSAWTAAVDETFIDKEAWGVYRQDVRNIVLQPGYPDSITWPDIPE
jgi:hypothetical protein